MDVGDWETAMVMVGAEGGGTGGGKIQIHVKLINQLQIFAN